MSIRDRVAQRVERHRSRQVEPRGDTGERLATFARKDGAELRWVWDHYEGSPYLMAREWTAAGFPTRRGITVRCSELADVAEVLVAAMDLAEAEQHEK